MWIQGVEILDYSWTGHANQYLVPLKRSVAAICRSDRRISDFYIGVASGNDVASALRRRLDKQKMRWRCSKIWNLYSSTSRNSVLWLEDELISHFRRDMRLRNIASGGGGRLGEQTHHYLYLAFSPSTPNMQTEAIASALLHNSNRDAPEGQHKL